MLTLLLVIIVALLVIILGAGVVLGVKCFGIVLGFIAARAIVRWIIGKNNTKN